MNQGYNNIVDILFNKTQARLFLVRGSITQAVATEQSLFLAQIQSSGALSTFDY